MALPVFQKSFASGELAPALYARTDLTKYASGAALLRNFFPLSQGGAATRPGTAYVARCYKQGKPVRLIPFRFNNEQTYTLEFGNGYMRVVMNGGLVLEPAQAITGITQADPGVVTVVAHGWSSGNWISLAEITGMTELNNRVVLITVLSADTFSIQDLDGNDIDTTSFTAFAGFGTAARVFVMSTPYDAFDLADLKYTQSADVMTLTHPNYVPYNLTRTSHYQWTLTAIAFGATQGPPTTINVAASAAGSTEFKYTVTAISADGKEESLAATAGADTGVDMTVTAGHYLVGWTAPAGATPSRYNVYRAPITPGGSVVAGALFGYVGSAQGTSFVDTNIIPDFTRSPPENANPFSGNNPAVSTYYQQRKVYAGSDDFPDTFYASQIGNFDNFDTSTPARDSDAITGTIASQQVNAIEWLVPMSSGLIALTSGGAWQISGGQQGAPFTPASATADPQAFNGANVRVPPLTVNYDILYVQSKGAIVRDLAYNFYVNVYTGQDMTILSPHLFLGYQILDWAWAEEPFKIVWAIRDDGTLLSFTYLKEQEVYAWAHHDTEYAGLFQSVASISEGNEDAVYFVVQRQIPGVDGEATIGVNASTAVQYIERFASRALVTPWNDYQPDPTAAWSVDCGAQYPLVILDDAGCTPSGLTGTIVLTADSTNSSAVFTGVFVGRIVRINGGICEITAFTDPFTVTAVTSRDLNHVRRSPPGTWTCTVPTDTVSGLQHLEGATVSVLAAGSVVADQIVVDGSISIPQPADVITVGLGFVAQLQTLYIDFPSQEGAVAGRRKTIPSVIVRMQDTRGLTAGPDFDTLSEIKQRGPATPMGLPIPLYTGDEPKNIRTDWQQTGRGQVCFEQRYPLPATILGVVPQVLMGDTPG